MRFFKSRQLSLRREAAVGLGLLPLFFLAALLVSLLLSAATPTRAAPLLSPTPEVSPVNPGDQSTLEPGATQVLEPTSTPDPKRRRGSSRDNPPELVVNWPMFIDTMVVALSYFWLCCGGLVMVGVPFVLGMAYILGQRRSLPPPGNPEAGS